MHTSSLGVLFLTNTNPKGLTREVSNLAAFMSSTENEDGDKDKDECSSE
jgi:hypothetical protein